MLVPLLLLVKVGGIVTLAENELMSLDYEGVVNDLVEKVLVMAGNNEAALLMGKVSSNLSPSRQVEVVCRLVEEEEDVVLGEEGGELDFSALTPAESLVWLP